MKPGQLLSPSVRAAFFDPPTDAAGIVRHYAFSPEDLALIGQRRHDPNRDRTFENQRCRASGLNLAVAAVILWNTVYLRRAVDELRGQGEEVPDTQLARIAPLGWEHISFSGDYIWPAEPIRDQFRPLRTSRSSFLDGP